MSEFWLSENLDSLNSDIFILSEFFQKNLIKETLCPKIRIVWIRIISIVRIFSKICNQRNTMSKFWLSEISDSLNSDIFLLSELTEKNHYYVRILIVRKFV